MSSNPTSLHKQKKAKRKEILEKKKVIDEVIKSATVLSQPLAPFHAFHRYNRNGLSVYLDSESGDKLSSSVKQYIQNLLKVNMEGSFGPEWPAEEKVKRREMVNPEARYIFVYEAQDVSAGNVRSMESDNGSLVGFVQYRFTLEEEIPVLYVYEVQLESHVQGKGLGKFLMQLIELIACKNRMSAVVLTVQKENVKAMNFYRSKMSYNISSISPSKVDPLIGMESSYEILCKTFNLEAKSTLENKETRGVAFLQSCLFYLGCVKNIQCKKIVVIIDPELSWWKLIALLLDRNKDKQEKDHDSAKS